MPSPARAFVFGDDISTDALAPGAFLKLSLGELAKHCLESVDPRFAGSVRPGDCIVAGRNFGLGSSREQAAAALKQLGVCTIIAKSFARIFYRNAINLGLLPIVHADTHEIADGDPLIVDAKAGFFEDLASGKRYAFEPVPEHLMAIILAGGLIPQLKQRFAAQAVPGKSA